MIDRTTIETVTELVIKQLGNKATPDLIKKVVSEVVNRLETNTNNSKITNLPNESETITTTQMQKCATCPNQIGNNKEQAIVAVFGKDHPGVIAGLTGTIASFGVSLGDITQTITGTFFSMIMLVDISNLTADFAIFKEKLEEEGNLLGVKVYVQHSEIFEYMHRV